MSEEAKEKSRARAKTWYQANKERKSAQNKAWRLANKGRDAQSSREWRAANPEKVKRMNLRRAFGITVEEAVEIWEKQGCSCAVCSTPVRSPAECGAYSDRGTASYVDHNHATGEVRGILCNRCNTGIGLLKDSVANLQAATAYLLGV